MPWLEITYIEDYSTAAARETQWFAGKREEYVSFGLQAAYLNVHGQRRESSTLYRRAAETALGRGFTDVAAGFEEADARADALVGDCTTARRLGRPALALAMCGDAAQAKKLAAAAEFKKILDHKGTSWGSTWRDPNWGLHYSIAYLGLARALALAGGAVPARRAYEDFFAAWKDADTDIPILQQARADTRV